MKGNKSMTKKDYIVIADILGNKLQEVKKWRGQETITAVSLSLAYIEDFITALSKDNPHFDRIKFIAYINKKYQVELLQGGF